jgi:hypothetical protein
VFRGMTSLPNQLPAVCHRIVFTSSMSLVASGYGRVDGHNITEHTLLADEYRCDELNMIMRLAVYTSSNSSSSLFA